MDCQSLPNDTHLQRIHSRRDSIHRSIRNSSKNKMLQTVRSNIQALSAKAQLQQLCKNFNSENVEGFQQELKGIWSVVNSAPYQSILQNLETIDKIIMQQGVQSSSILLLEASLATRLRRINSTFIQKHIEFIFQSYPAYCFGFQTNQPLQRELASSSLRVLTAYMNLAVAFQSQTLILSLEQAFLAIWNNKSTTNDGLDISEVVYFLLEAITSDTELLVNTILPITLEIYNIFKENCQVPNKQYKYLIKMILSFKSSRNYTMWTDIKQKLMAQHNLIETVIQEKNDEPPGLYFDKIFIEVISNDKYLTQLFFKSKQLKRCVLETLKKRIQERARKQSNSKNQDCRNFRDEYQLSCIDRLLHHQYFQIIQQDSGLIEAIFAKLRELIDSGKSMPQLCSYVNIGFVLLSQAQSQKELCKINDRFGIIDLITQKQLWSNTKSGTEELFRAVLGLIEQIVSEPKHETYPVIKVPVMDRLYALASDYFSTQTEAALEQISNHIIPKC